MLLAVSSGIGWNGRNGLEFRPETFFGAFRFGFGEFRHVPVGTGQNGLESITLILFDGKKMKRLKERVPCYSKKRQNKEEKK